MIHRMKTMYDMWYLQIFTLVFIWMIPIKKRNAFMTFLEQSTSDTWYFLPVPKIISPFSDESIEFHDPLNIELTEVDCVSHRLNSN